MKVLIISSNPLPASPTGPVYVAGAVRQAGHEVQIYDRLFAADLASEITKVLEQFRPDVIGVSIRLVFGDTLDQDAPRSAERARPATKPAPAVSGIRYFVA